MRTSSIFQHYPLFSILLGIMFLLNSCGDGTDISRRSDGGSSGVGSVPVDEQLGLDEETIEPDPVDYSVRLEDVATEDCLDFEKVLQRFREFSDSGSYRRVTFDFGIYSSFRLRSHFGTLSAVGAFVFEEESVRVFLDEFEGVTQEGCESITLRPPYGEDEIFKIEATASRRAVSRREGSFSGVTGRSELFFRDEELGVEEEPEAELEEVPVVYYSDEVRFVHPDGRRFTVRLVSDQLMEYRAEYPISDYQCQSSERGVPAMAWNAQRIRWGEEEVFERETETVSTQYLRTLLGGMPPFEEGLAISEAVRTARTPMLEAPIEELLVLRETPVAERILNCYGG
jgi:hypothetical protein